MAKKGGGGGGSQLSQLKSRLRNDGITDRRQMKLSAKKRKRGQAGAEKDEMAERREKLSKIASSSAFNPFEERVTKPKNEVLGRRIKGAVGRPGVAKMGGLKERTDRLLPEWRDRNKSGSFVDRRFGENGSDNLSLEEKMLERFTKERQSRVGKSSMFNLDDGEEEGLTHYGKSLNDLDDYDDIHLSDEEEGLQEEGAHFGGFEEDRQKAEETEGDEERTKSKAEVMREVMAKSKLAKYERQQTRMADDEMRTELDKELGDIRSMLFDVPKPAAVEEAPAEKRPLFGDGSRKDAYDSAVRELAFERRAKPQDRLQTEAEKAEQLAEKLKKAESDRLKRMRGEELSDDEGTKKGKKGRIQGGDDLEDDFELDGMTSRDVYGLGRGLVAQEDQESNDDEEDDEDDGDEDDEDEDEEDDNDDEADFGDLADLDGTAQPGEDDEVEDDGENEEEALTMTASKRKASRTATPAKVLPFTFPCPSTHDELLGILESNKVSSSQVPIVLKRIRALYHPSLAEVNKFKLQAFLGVLLDHIVFTSTQFSTTQDNTAAIQLIDSIVAQVFSLSKIYPATSAEHFVNKLALMQRNLVRGVSKGPLLAESKTWPGPTECVLLKITSTIWPVSDRVHAVTTPLSILIGQYLSSCRIRNVRDLASGLFLCCLTYNNERQSMRVVPESLNYLNNAVTLLAPVKSMKQLRQTNQAFGIPWPEAGSDGLKALKTVNTKVAPKEKVDFMSVLGGKEADAEESKASILFGCFSLISDFASLYTGSPAFVEIFEPFRAILSNLGDLHPKLEEKLSSTQTVLTRMINNAKSERRSLRLQAHRAIAIASHVPKFDQGFNPERRGGRTFDPDAERAEQAKLRSLLKKERKGAIRELRRDNEFLANEKRKEREEEDQRYKKTIDKIVGSLSSERSEQKKYLQEKDRLKRRSGKK